jgi:hypothetical protein
MPATSAGMTDAVAVRGKALIFRNIACRLTQISNISLAVPPPLEGRFAIVTDVGCGMRWTRAALLTRALFVDGEDVWS